MIIGEFDFKRIGIFLCILVTVGASNLIAYNRVIRVIIVKRNHKIPTDNVVRNNNNHCMQSILARSWLLR